MDTIADGAVALIHYTLTNDQGEVLDSSEGGDPLPYLHGARNIVPGLEKELVGMEVGESKNIDVNPEEGYGVVNPAMIQTVARAQFPPEADVEPGVQFLMQGDNGESMPIWVTNVENGMVTIDANHPLAGQTLHFAVTIAGIREATSSETEAGYPNGLTGEEINN